MTATKLTPKCNVTQEFEKVTCSAKKGSVILKKKIKEIFPYLEIFHRKKKIKIVP